LVGSIRSVEVGEVEALGDTLLVGLGWAQDEVAHGVNLNPSAFPELRCVRHTYTFHRGQTYQSIGELNVQVANVNGRRGLSERRESGRVLLRESQIGRRILPRHRRDGRRHALEQLAGFARAIFLTLLVRDLVVVALVAVVAVDRLGFTHPTAERPPAALRRRAG
jgi:hypothetical protein